MIRLEYFTPDDFPLLIDWINSEDLLVNWAGTQFKFPLTDEKLHHYLKHSNDFDHSRTLNFKVVETVSGENIGHVSLSVIDRENRSARITRVLVGNSDKRGTGLGSKIIKSMLKIGFEDLNLHRMSLGVYDFNVAGIKCYTKCGFKIDGILRDIKRMPDTFWSIIEMSILESEYHSMYKDQSTLLSVDAVHERKA